jgi:hypothetical protein
MVWLASGRPPMVYFVKFNIPSFFRGPPESCSFRHDVSSRVRLSLGR